MRFTSYAGLMVLILPIAAQAQQPLTFDLTQTASDTIPIRADTEYRVIAEFAVPAAIYTLQDVPIIKDVDPLRNLKTAGRDCSVNEQLKGLREAATEVEVRLHAEALKSLLESEKTACGKAELDAARRALETTKREWSIGPYERNTVVILTIRRPGTKANEPGRTWVRHLETPPDGRWETTFGFSFIKQVMSKPQAFYSRDSAGVFVITEKADYSDLDFAPTILYRYVSASGAGNTFTWDKVLGGLGVSVTEAPLVTVMLATGVSYKRNLTLYGGFALAPVQKLDGRYEANQVITENLGDNQLHSSQYGFNPVLGLAFRFGSSPWEGKKTKPTDVKAVSP